MKSETLSVLTAAAQAARAPGFLPEIKVKPGGIDPLGLRQINFDVMDRLIPGTNNVTWYVRPFTLVTWAWDRALVLVGEEGLEFVNPDLLLDFVDRMEVIYAWSQFATENETGSLADLPGRDTLSGIMTAGRYRFGGPAWEAFRNRRRYSTALSAPNNYGPALKALHLLRVHQAIPSVMRAAPFTHPALQAFEKRISGRLQHPVFSRLGSVDVTSKDVAEWGGDWDLWSTTAAERRMMMEALRGDDARCKAIKLVKATTASSEVLEDWDLRQRMCVDAGADEDLAPTIRLWRYLQVRQLFRLALEGAFDWMTLRLRNGPRTTAWLVEEFLRNAPGRARHRSAAQWFKWRSRDALEAPDLIVRLQEALDTRSSAKIVPAVSDALAFCLTASAYDCARGERDDRLPLTKAHRELMARGAGTPAEMIRHVLESWVVAQHVYWAVGRGLADARAGGKRILRLKVVLGDGGWELTPNASSSAAPRATGDRLAALHSLLKQCKALDGTS